MTAAEQRVVETLEAALGRRRVLLCGSRAVGSSTAGSDYDVLVALPLPWIPFAIPKLAKLSRTLSAELGVGVTINPLPSRALRRRKPNLFAWKIARESVQLSGAACVRPAEGLPTLSDPAKFSYLASALWYLLDDVTDEGPAAGRGEQKARLHLAQLRLLEQGRYASMLEDAVTATGDERLRMGSWLATRDLVLASLRPLLAPQSRRRAFVVNVRYATLSALRRRMRFASALASQPVDAAVASSILLLAEAIGADERQARRCVRLAAELLPRGARPATPTWRAVLEAARGEWPSAHPLLAQ
ncbi:MAG TPA: hypothetical protein VE982_01915 [Gaiellaceae bacterium]|nr:hypothetical protein [Gaiellaceae bacterium]